MADLPHPTLDRDARLLVRRLAEIRDRWRTARVASGLLAAGAGAAAAALLLTGGEALFHLPGPARWAALLAFLGLLAAALGLLVARPAVERLTLERTARLVEQRRPELGNALIAGLQLARQPGGAPQLAAAAVCRAARSSALVPADATVDRAAQARLARLCALSVALLAAGFALAPSRMSSALLRLAMPGSFIPRTGSVRIVEVRPGDARVPAGEEVAVSARIEPVAGGGQVAARLFHREGSGPELSRRMDSADGGTYTCVLPGVEGRTRYRVEIGDSQSPWYLLTAAERPAVTGLDLEYAYPEFTGRAPERFENVAGREIRVPAGTGVRLTARTNRPVRSGTIEFGDGTVSEMRPAASGLTAEFRVEKSGSYSIALRDEAGHGNLNPPRHPIVAVPDCPPAVSVPAPGRDVELPVGATLPLAVTASDDYGLRSVRLVFSRNRGGERQELAAWPDLPGPRSVQRGHAWKLSPRDFDPGDVIFCHAEADDRSQTGSSPVFQIRLIDPRAARARRLKSLADFIAELRRVLEAQQSARSAATTLFAAAPAEAGLPAGCARLAGAQKAIRADTLAAAESAPVDDGLVRRVRDAALLLAAGPELEAETAAADLAADAAAAGDPRRRERLTAAQDAVLRRLRELLQIMEGLQARATAEDDREASDLPDDVRAKLEALREKLGDFQEEQKKVLDAWNELAKRPVEDLTDAEKKKLEALAATEDKWEKFLKEAHSDLSKLQKQDFTDPKLLKELVETYSEVEMAKDALTKASKEVPVPVEQAGLESAEALTTHLEKWLPDTPDRDQWAMEEPLTENQTPMAELPEQLEDLVGDLMEEQEDIFEEMEDTSSSWSDSLDKGAGWDAMDGPISNMSAQGVTGNRLPNSSEISGRSGEGRTGKAAGEFVEDSAAGKGGRNTPTRLTPDQFLKGQIDDKSKDPAGGSTGGGKTGGAGGEGLEGPPPPDSDAGDARLAGRQAQVLSRAERLRLELKVRNHPTADLDRVIEMMRGLQGDIKDGRYRNIARQRQVTIEGLKTTRDFAAAASSVQRESSRALPKGLREDLFDAMEGGVPAGYEELVRKYYESISQPAERASPPAE